MSEFATATATNNRREPGIDGLFRPYDGNWVALVLRASVAIVLGMLAFIIPGMTLAAIVLLFGTYAIADGVFAIAAAIRARRRKDRWGWTLVEGILGIAAGVIALTWPGIGALSLTILVGVWALVMGASQLVAAVKLRKVIRGEWLLLLGGILSIVFAALVLLRPDMGALVLVWWLGAYLLAYGAIALAFGIRARRWSSASAPV
jgi:uncharacterized membrane protein HdeD (DUF308 family)